MNNFTFLKRNNYARLSNEETHTLDKFSDQPSSPELVDKVLKEKPGSSLLKQYVLDKSSHVRSAHIHMGLDDPDVYVNHAAINHNHAQPEHIDKALNSPHEKIRETAVKHKNASSENISKGLDDRSPRIRTSAILHPNAQSHHISKALNNHDYVLRATALKHNNASSENISKGLEDNHHMVRRFAMVNPNAQTHHISKGLNDEDPGVRSHAVQHNNATLEHIQKGLSDTHSGVHEHAKIAEIGYAGRRNPKQSDMLGWRGFSLTRHKGRLILKSPMQGTPWHEDELEAKNYHVGENLRGKGGIHAVSMPHDWKKANPHPEFRGSPVSAVVQRFGTSVVGTEGWRARRVRILEIGAHPSHVEELQKSYPDVKVHGLPHLPKMDV